MNTDNMPTKSFNTLIKIATFFHKKARVPEYPSSAKQRFSVPDDKVKWDENFPEYNPTEYTAEFVLKKPIWADPDINKSKEQMRFNKVDGLVNRVSFNGEYEIDNGRPLNPVGRTGLTGRGVLGKWGPNHAADPIVTRWKNQNNEKVPHPVSKRPILQFVAVQRADSKEWAIPGGMVDANETISVTLKREFGEEALNSLEMSNEKKIELEKKIAEIFSNGVEIYKGYVDDPRNTDNAWMETVAMNFHDEDGTSVGSLPLHAGDDAGDVCWMDIDSETKLYASHSYFLQLVCERLGAHW